MASETGSSVLEDLEQEIQKEENFEEIVSEYQILSALSDGSFYELPITNAFRSEDSQLFDRILLEFEVNEELYGYIPINTDNYPYDSESLDILFEAIDSNGDLGSINLRLDEDFQSGEVLISDSIELYTNVLWPYEVDLNKFKEVNNDSIWDDFIKKSEIRSYYRENSNSLGVVVDRVESVNGSKGEAHIELNFEWGSRNLTWVIPRPKEDSDVAEIVSEYGSLNGLEGSKFHILPESEVSSEYNSEDYFVDESENWALFSEDAYSKYVKVQQETEESEEDSDSSESNERVARSGITHKEKFYRSFLTTALLVGGVMISYWLIQESFTPPQDVMQLIYSLIQLLIFLKVVGTLFQFARWKVLDV